MEIRLIPGTLGFLADSEGNVYDHNTVKRNTYRNGDGYVTASVLIEGGEWVTFGVHYLVALAFYGLPEKGFDQVNHIDCNVENNQADNLEWVSVAQNNIYAEITRKDNIRPSILAMEGLPEEYEFLTPAFFMNVWDATVVTDIDVSQIWHSIKTGELVDDPKGMCWRFTFQKYSASIPKELQKPRMPEKKGVQALPKKAVKVRDIDSDVVFKFESIADAARHFDVGTSAIHQAIPQRDVVRVFKKKYQIAYDGEQFLELSEEDWEKAKNTGPRDVVAYNHIEDKFWFFESGVAYLAHSKLSKKAVTTALAKNKLRKIGDWTALYYEGENFRTLIEHVKGSSPGVIVSTF